MTTASAKSAPRTKRTYTRKTTKAAQESLPVMIDITPITAEPEAPEAPKSKWEALKAKALELAKSGSAKALEVAKSATATATAKAKEALEKAKEVKKQDIIRAYDQTIALLQRCIAWIIRRIPQVFDFLKVMIFGLGIGIVFLVFCKLTLAGFDGMESPIINYLATK